jgi:hypothetical protein
VDGPSSFACFPFLPSVALGLHALDLHITELPVDGGEGGDRVGLVTLARSIRACHGLRKLTLAASVECALMMMSSALLSSCLVGLPELHTLHLESVRLSSLSFLSRAPLPRSLTHLSLLSLMTCLLPEDLLYIFELKALQELTLKSVLAEPMSEDMARQLRPSSSERLPSLLRSNIARAFVPFCRDLAFFGMPLLKEEEYKDGDAQ